MGRTVMKNLKYVLFFFILFSTKIYSQNTIKGVILNSGKEKIAFAHIEVKKDSFSSSIYLYANKNGEFEIKNIPNNFKLKISALGYKTKKIILSFNKENLKKLLKIILTEKIIDLDEVIIRAKKPIVVKKDTISFKTKFFVNGTEQTVEDLLKTIPGVNIETDGTIKIGNQEIEKLMVDGDDFFEKGYKILSKNMPAYSIDKVELLVNYSNNRILNTVEESNKVALNLKLNDNSRRIWFGNIETSIGNNFHQQKANLMNFGKKNKYYFLTNLNNIGVDPTGDLENLIRPFRMNEPASIGDNQTTKNLIHLSASSLNFKKSRTNFNNTKLLSLNAIFNPTQKLKIKTLGFFNWDENEFYRNSVNNVTTNNINFTNTENYQLNNKKKIGFGKLDFIYNISKTKMLESTTKYNSGSTNGQSDLAFNDTSTNESLQSNNTLFDQKTTYSNKFKEKKVLLLTGRFINENSPQNYTVNHFLYQDLFPGSSVNNVQQQSINKMQFIGFDAHLLDRKTNGNLLELQLGNTFRKDKHQTEFTLLENTTIISTPNNFQNDLEYKFNNLYLKSKYHYKIKDITITNTLGFYQLFSYLNIGGLSEKQQSFFLNPSIGLEWKINNENKITTSYSYNTTNAKIEDVSNNYVLTGFRSFSRGTGDFNQLDTSTLLLNYQLGNWGNRFFANTFVFFAKNFDFLSTNTILNRNYTQSEKILIKDRAFLSVSSKLDYYFKEISSNLKIDLGFSKSNYKNVINNSNLQEVTSYNYNYGLELRSGFKGVANYHIGTKWTTNQIETSTITNSFTNNVSFLDLSFVFNDKFNVEIQTEHYFFGNHDQKNNTYSFLDFDARYTLKKNKLTLALTGKNLFNTQTFRNFSISDIGTSTTEYRLLERFVLLKMEYRF